MTRIYELLGRLIWISTRPITSRIMRGSTRSYVLLECGTQVLLVKNWIGSGKWRLPGGGVNSDETPAEGAARELYEELSIEIDPDVLTLKTKYSYRARHIHIFSYQLTAKPEFSRFKPELTSARWCTLTEVELDGTFGMLHS
ncbi:MAG: NUDIX hydrolase [Patescibacteria group bacterium]